MAKVKGQRRGAIEVAYAACTGCRLCEMAGSLFHEATVWPDAFRIRGELYYPVPLDVPAVCHRCFERYRAAACPSGALGNGVAAEVVRLDAGDCIQCGACYQACSHSGAIAPHPKTNYHRRQHVQPRALRHQVPIGDRQSHGVHVLSGRRF
jgi:Fe-S-cluster-containing hydrogenase component 2